MNEKVFEPFPILETERIFLRKIKEDDIPGIYRFYSGSDTLKNIARDNFTKKEQAIEKVKLFHKSYEERKAIWWTFNQKPKDEFIGFGGLFEISKKSNKAEIGYGLLPDYWGKGIMSEVVEKLIDFGFNQMKLHKIYGRITPGHNASIRLLEKLGFKKEGDFKDDEFAQNKYFDTAYYSLINKK
ncbi:MAG: GNAT family N-acetyltransferase [Ignavibacterium sp.]|nr:MAG: GNAT family N-acetyltransferase [Ignavibacterium sp.]